MTISLVLGWITVLFAILTAAKYIARKSGNPKFNHAFSKMHKPIGILLLIFAIVHGILAGNPAWSTLTDFSVAPVLFTINLGTICLLLAIALGVTYLLRKKLKKNWMLLHRVLTVAFIVCIVLHILDVGIQLPGRIMNLAQSTHSETLDTKDSENKDSETIDTKNSEATNSETIDTEITDSTTSEASDSAVTFSGATLADGTYQGSSDGYNGTIKVSVTVTNGAVTDIMVIEENDTPDFFTRAQSILTAIQRQQSLDVDTVSGATFSSAGLINAVTDALNSAVTSGELVVNKVDLSSVNRHGGGGRH